MPSRSATARETPWEAVAGGAQRAWKTSRRCNSLPLPFSRRQAFPAERAFVAAKGCGSRACRVGLPLDPPGATTERWRRTRELWLSKRTDGTVRTETRLLGKSLGKNSGRTEGKV
eukprot:scaffold1528_cov198-Pinguiococcus_pyrenoidosus.AAC.16